MCHSWQRGVWPGPLLIQTSQSPLLSHSSTQLQCSPSVRLMVGIIDKVLSRRDYGLFSAICPQICVRTLRKLQDTLGLRALSHTRSDNEKCCTSRMFICRWNMIDEVLLCITPSVHFISGPWIEVILVIREMLVFCL